MASDKRFSHLASDPKFRSLPRSQTKFHVDERFGGMFDDKRFSTCSTMFDKRGRRILEREDTRLQKFYELRRPDGVLINQEDCTQTASQDFEFQDSIPTRAKIKKKTLKKLCKKESVNAKNKSISSSTKPKNKRAKSTSDRNKSDNTQHENDSKSNKRRISVKKIPKTNQSKLLKNEDCMQTVTDLNDDFSDTKSLEIEPPTVREDSDTLHLYAADRARGCMADSSCEDSSDTDNQSDCENSDAESRIIHKWAELDNEAELVDTKSCIGWSRLAVCNLDWQNVRAVDIMVMLSSFLPVTPDASACVKSVTVYLSEFGRQRLHEEELRGPHNLANGHTQDPHNTTDDGVSSSEECVSQERSEYVDTIDDSAHNELEQITSAERETSYDSGTESRTEADESCTEADMEAVRDYEISRLRYYYAIVQCDSGRTANAIYDECNQLEFESSACRLDIRLVPDNVVFDDVSSEHVRDVCCSLPQSAEEYRPPLFVHAALQHKRVTLTWDRNEQGRVEVFRRAFEDSRQKSLDTCFDEVDRYVCGSDTDSEAADCLAYRKLLEPSDSSRIQKEDDTRSVGSISGSDSSQIEIMWANETTDKEMLGAPDETIVGEMESELSELEDRSETVTKRKTKRKSRKKGAEREEAVRQEDGMEDERCKKQKLAELALIVAPDTDTVNGGTSRKHFNYDHIVKLESGRKTKKKRNKQSDEQLTGPEDQQPDLFDPRFSKLYTSAEYNVDPSHSLYKPTRWMGDFIEQKQRYLERREDKVSALQSDRRAEDIAVTQQQDIGDTDSVSRLITKLRKKKPKLYC